MFSNKIRYLLLIALAGLISILYNEYIMGLLFLIVLLLPLVLLALLGISCGMVKAELHSMVHVASKGEKVPITIQLYNPTIIPIYGMKIDLIIRNRFASKHHKKELMVTMDGRSNLCVSCDLQSKYVGNLEITLKGIRCYDYLKLFSLKKKCKASLMIAILPNFYEVEEEIVTNRSGQYTESEHYSPAKSGDDPSEVFAIRKYREGDRIQRIHWKLSSKQNELMIKEFSDPVNCSVLIFLDLSISKDKDSLAYIDALLESALSISYTLLMRKQYHYFSWFDSKRGICRRMQVLSEKDFYEIIAGLIENPNPTHPFNALSTYLAQYPKEQYTDVFYITGEISDGKLDYLSLLMAAEKRIIYLQEEGNNIRQEIRSLNINKNAEDNVNAIAKLGIGLSSINIHNLRSEIQNLRLN